jgi:rSAM/selenodomain-associated transferase 2
VSTLRISVVVPALDEAAGIAATLTHVRQPGVHETIVVDGGSRDGTAALAAPHADRVITASRGRALQMNTGAAAATGDILVFLHADTRPPAGFAAAVAAACTAPDVVGGRFDVRIEPATPLLRLVAGLMNARSRLTRIATGDQVIFVRRDVFEQLGGYAPIPIMEDIEFSRRLKRAGRIACLRVPVVTSARRWHARGVVRTILLMWALRALYWCGMSPQRLQRLYDDTR